MNFSIKATIRAWLVPKHRINCCPHLWSTIINELERRGERRHESGTFLLGRENRGRSEVIDAIFYDDLAPNVYDTGACVLGSDAFSKLWAACREKRLTVVADVHTHPHAAIQSVTDKVNPMIARAGHVAIIVPNFAIQPVLQEKLGIYEYLGDHRWIDRTSSGDRHFFYSGLLS